MYKCTGLIIEYIIVLSCIIFVWIWLSTKKVKKVAIESEKTDVNKKLQYEVEDVMDALTTALEGGSNDWYYIVEDIPENKEYCRVDNLLRSIIYDNKSYTIIDVEDKEEVLGYLNLENIIAGIDLYEQEREPFDAAMDASEADCLLQYIVMGEIVYG